MRRLPVLLALVVVVLISGVLIFRDSAQSPQWDEDALYAFVREEIKDISRSLFAEQWEIVYYDVTDDGHLEALLVESYGVDWHPYVEIVSKAEGRYQRVPSKIHAGKYGTLVERRDGLLAVTTRTGGPGEELAYLSLYAADAGEVVSVLDNLLVYQRVAFPNADFEVQAEITGSFSDFVYRQVKADFVTGEETVAVVQHFRYDPDGMRFEISAKADESAAEM